jgi:hypothetical protein
MTMTKCLGRPDSVIAFTDSCQPQWHGQLKSAGTGTSGHRHHETAEGGDGHDQRTTIRPRARPARNDPPSRPSRPRRHPDPETLFPSGLRKGEWPCPCPPRPRQGRSPEIRPILPDRARPHTGRAGGAADGSGPQRRRARAGPSVVVASRPGERQARPHRDRPRRSRVPRSAIFAGPSPDPSALQQHNSSTFTGKSLRPSR